MFMHPLVCSYLTQLQEELDESVPTAPSSTVYGLWKRKMHI